MRILKRTCCALLAMAWCALAVGEEQPQVSVEQALAGTILQPGQSTAEMKAFIEPRIPRFAPPATLAQWESTAAHLRTDMLDQIIFRGGAAAWRDATARVEWLDTIAGGPGYHIRKFRYEALPGMWIPGLLYEPEHISGRVPLALHVNGHAPEGKAVDYKQLRSINLAKRGMLVLNVEWFGMGQLRTPGFSHHRLNQMDLCGASGLAPFYLAMSRALDLGLQLEHADPGRVAVSGLSGGGWQTILISSLDPRVTLANPVAGYGSLRTNIAFDDLGDSEQAPTDMALVGDYSHLTALRAPRPTLLTYNAGDDCCFKSGHTLDALVAAARPVYTLYGAEDRLRSHVNYVPGTHNFEQENREKLYALVGDHFFVGDASYPRREIPSQDELKTAEALNVLLPADNIDFHRLAQGLATALPRDASLPSDSSQAGPWQRQRREQLKALLKVPHYEATAADAQATASADGQMNITPLKLQVGSSWSVPAIEMVLAKAQPTRATIMISDAGRSTTAKETTRLLTDNNRVLAADLLFWGEARAKAQDPDYLFPLFIAAVGERPLGIQAAQLAAIARWSKTRHPQEDVWISAHGPRASMAALVAAAVEPGAIAGLELGDSLASLHELIDQDKTVETLPELFAFGLLAEFDVRQLVALAAPRPVTFREPTARMRQEMAPLGAWYALFGVKFTQGP